MTDETCQTVLIAAIISARTQMGLFQRARPLFAKAAHEFSYMRVTNALEQFIAECEIAKQQVEGTGRGV